MVSKEIVEILGRFDFTKQQMRVGFCLVAGLRAKEISEILDTKEKTVRFHFSNMMKKMKTKTEVKIVNRYDFSIFILKEYFKVKGLEYPVRCDDSSFDYFALNEKPTTEGGTDVSEDH